MRHLGPRGLVVWCWLAVSAGRSVLGGQLLTPQMQVDRALQLAERQVETGNYGAALRSLDRVVRLRTEHDLELPGRFWVTHGEVALEAGSHRQAFLSAMRYLELPGSPQDHAAAALRVLEEAEAKGTDELAQVRAVAASMDFVWVPAGEFRMGSTSRESDRDEQRYTRVRLTEGFWLAAYEVTQTEWIAVMGTNPSHFDECGPCPVEQVSWEDVQEFIWLLNAGEAGRYRLPTEAEWEYAARAGTRGDRYARDLDGLGWCVDNSEESTHPVGQKAPNSWGLYDMVGNVWEWVQDIYGPYPGVRVTDPEGPAVGSLRVLRGGGWSNRTRHCRTSSRSNDDPDFGYVNVGFRLLREE